MKIESHRAARRREQLGAHPWSAASWEPHPPRLRRGGERPGQPPKTYTSSVPTSDLQERISFWLYVLCLTLSTNSY